jgi:hypothetical protein
MGRFQLNHKLGIPQIGRGESMPTFKEIEITGLFGDSHIKILILVVTQVSKIGLNLPHKS